MKKLLYIISLVLSMLIVFALPSTASAGKSYTDYFTERDAGELAEVRQALFEQYDFGLGDFQRGDDENSVDVRYLMKSYLFKVFTAPELAKLYDESGSFEAFLSDNYMYRCCAPGAMCSATLLKNETGTWEIGVVSADLKIMREERFPGLDYTLAGMVDAISAKYPGFDYESVKYIHAYNEIVSSFLYFRDGGDEYVAVYYITPDRFDFPNGSILPAKELVEILINDPFFAVRDDRGGKIKGGGASGKAENSTIQIIILCAAVPAALAATAITTVLVIKKKRKSSRNE